MDARALGLLAVLLVGCTTVPVFHETGDPADVERWRTETRQPWRWYGAPVWQAPADLYFPTQSGCEAFRHAHPTYTRPDEVCVAVRGQLGTLPVWR